MKGEESFLSPSVPSPSSLLSSFCDENRACTRRKEPFIEVRKEIEVREREGY